MATAKLQNTNRFLFSDNGYMPTGEELRQQILAAEKSPVITHTQFKAQINEWRSCNLSQKNRI